MGLMPKDSPSLCLVAKDNAASGRTLCRRRNARILASESGLVDATASHTVYLPSPPVWTQLQFQRYDEWKQGICECVKYTAQVVKCSLKLLCMGHVNTMKTPLLQKQRLYFFRGDSKLAISSISDFNWFDTRIDVNGVQKRDRNGFGGKSLPT